MQSMLISSEHSKDQMARKDEMEATQIPALAEQDEADHAPGRKVPEQEAPGPSLKLQRAHAQKIEAELNLRKFSIERDIEQLEHSHAAKSQQLAFVSKQANLKQDELQSLRTEVKSIDDVVSQKRLTIETLKTSIDGERQELIKLKNASSDLQTDIQKLNESRLTQQQTLLDNERQIQKLQLRQSTTQDEIGKIEAELVVQQDLLKSDTTRLKGLHQKQQKLEEELSLRLGERQELDKQIHAQRERLASILDECQDKSESILSEARHDADQMRDEAQKTAELFLHESQQKAQTLVADAILNAENSSEKIVSAAQQEAAGLLASARDQSRLLIEEAETRAADANTRSQNHSEQLLEEARQEADGMIGKARSDSEQLTLEAHRRVEQLQASAYEEKQGIIEAAELARGRIIEEAQEAGQKQFDQVDHYTRKIREEAETTKQLLQTEINELAGFLTAEKQRFYHELEVEREQLLQSLKDDRQQLTSRIHEVDVLRQQLTDDYQREKAQLYQEVSDEKALIEQKNQALSLAAEEARRRLEVQISERRLEFEQELQTKKDLHDQELVVRSQKLSEEWDRKGEKISRALEQKGQEAEQQVQAMKAKAEQEVRDLRERTERELVQLRIQHESALHNWIKAQQDNFHTVRNRHRNQILDTITTLVQAAIRSQITDMDPARLTQLSTVTRKAAEEAFLDAEQQTQAVSLHAPQTMSASSHFKDLRYWRNLFLHSSLKWGALALLLCLGGFLWKKSSENQTMSAANSYVEDQIKQRKKIPYVPEQSRTFKASYTDNVLYTKNYLEHERHKNVRNRWIVALNRYGIDKLDMNNEVIVKMLAREAALLKQLEKMKGEIDGKDPATEIAAMRDLEEKYRQQLIAIVGSDEKFKSFLAFKANYFEKILQQDPD